MRLIATIYFSFYFSTILCSNNPGLATIRRIPDDGPMVEKDNANVTLHCDVPEPVDSVIWYYNGFVLRQIPDQGCSDDDIGSGSGSGDGEAFFDHELGSGFEGSYDPEYSLESNTAKITEDNSDSRLRRNVMEISEHELKNIVGGDDVYEYDDVYSDLEVSGSSGDDLITEDISGEVSGDADEPQDDLLLCDVDPTHLILHNLSRQFSGQYSCAPVVNNKVGPRADHLEIEVECKFDKRKMYLLRLIQTSQKYSSKNLNIRQSANVLVTNNVTYDLMFSWTREQFCVL